MSMPGGQIPKPELIESVRALLSALVRASVADIESAMDRVWDLGHTDQRTGRPSGDWAIDARGLDLAMWICAHPGIGTSRGATNAPPVASEFVREYRRRASEALECWLLVRELEGRKKGG